MKKIFVLLCAVIVVIGFSNIAGAAFITVSEGSPYSDDFALSGSFSFEWKADAATGGSDGNWDFFFVAVGGETGPRIFQDYWGSAFDWTPVTVSAPSGLTSLSFFVDNYPDPNNGANVYLRNFNPSPEGAPVPEPATMLLLGSGLVGIAGLSRKRFLKK